MLDKAQEVNVRTLMTEIGTKAREASGKLATAPTDQKNQALRDMAAAMRDMTTDILTKNALDLETMRSNGQTAAFLDRGTLDRNRVDSIAAALEDIIILEDPVGTVMADWERPNGLKIKRVRTPLGVIGVVYESRPNVTADAGALCLKAGNAVILRGGSDTINTNKAIHTALQQGLVAAGLPQEAIQMVPITDRSAVGEMLKGLGGTLDVIVPRGGKSLVSRVQSEARVPVFAHLEGLVHIFIDKKADLAKAIQIVVNSKMRRTGICGALETLLIDKTVASEFAPPLITALIEKECEIRGDTYIETLCKGVVPAVETDWSTEYLDKILSVKCVDGLEAAVEHIGFYGSNHTDCIVTEDQDAANVFFQKIDSAIVLHNASTQFADGGEFGMGAEIGIATGRMHARGPVGLEQLTSFKYQVHGQGQTRP